MITRKYFITGSVITDLQTAFTGSVYTSVDVEIKNVQDMPGKPGWKLIDLSYPSSSYNRIKYWRAPGAQELNPVFIELGKMSGSLSSSIHPTYQDSLGMQINKIMDNVTKDYNDLGNNW
tara:strand:+ start:79 stop:435 length:357 start_codon:yes stop_codon:yes gene_type:complete